MKPFTHKTVVGEFLDVLIEKHTARSSWELEATHKATARQDAILCVFAGDLDLEQLPKFAASLRKLLTNAVQLIVLDLSHVRIFSANAASVLVNFVSFVEGGGKRLILFRPSPGVRNALDALNLMHLFEVHWTGDDLLLDIPDGLKKGL